LLFETKEDSGIEILAQFFGLEEQLFLIVEVMVSRYFFTSISLTIWQRFRPIPLRFIPLLFMAFTCAQHEIHETWKQFTMWPPQQWAINHATATKWILLSPVSRTKWVAFSMCKMYCLAVPNHRFTTTLPFSLAPFLKS